MFVLAKHAGDNVPVPQLVFSRLLAADTGEARFRVALFMCMGGARAPVEVAKKLKIPLSEAEKALEFWEGAGLLERDGTAAAMAAAASLPAQKKRHMKTDSVVQAVMADPRLKAMLHELQRIHGGIVNEKDNQIYATLYCEDGYDAGLVLMAAAHCCADGTVTARRVEGLLGSWKKAGVASVADADRYLCLLAAREAAYAKAAAAMGITPKEFTARDRRMMDAWGEEFGFGEEMLAAAIAVAGENHTKVSYLNGVLKVWHARGYKTPKDVQSAEGAANVQATASRRTPPKDDLLANRGYVPMKRKRANK